MYRFLKKKNKEQLEKVMKKKVKECIGKPARPIRDQLKYKKCHKLCNWGGYGYENYLCKDNSFEDKVNDGKKYYPWKSFNDCQKNCNNHPKCSLYSKKNKQCILHYIIKRYVPWTKQEIGILPTHMAYQNLS